MEVGEHVRDEGKGLVVKGGDVEGLHELSIDLVNLRADNGGQEVVVLAADHANMVMGDHCVNNLNCGDVQIEFPVRINGKVCNCLQFEVELDCSLLWESGI